VIDFLREIKQKPSSMVNIKNGLAAALWDICRASSTGCRIFEKKIPLHQNTLKVSHELNYNPLVAALNGGEDYELLFTLPLSEHEKVITFFPENINMIGYLTQPDMSCRIITENNEEIDIKEIRLE
jgi:thiamine-monophosphate kinase